MLYLYKVSECCFLPEKAYSVSIELDFGDVHLVFCAAFTDVETVKIKVYRRYCSVSVSQLEHLYSRRYSSGTEILCS